MVCVPISSQTLRSIPQMTQRRLLIAQQEKLPRLAVSDYIDLIVDGRGLRQRVITQPRPNADIFEVRFTLGGFRLRGWPNQIQVAQVHP